MPAIFSQKTANFMLKSNPEYAPGIPSVFQFAGGAKII
jgi:hypothetical protein